MAKKRVDLLLVERGLADTRQKAQAVIMAGQVYTGERRCDKPGLTLEEDAPLEVRGGLRYVSRGGLKLEKAMQVFPIALTDKTAADIGASTGGFTKAAIWPSGAISGPRAGRISPREMKDTSTEAKSSGSGMCSAVR